MRPVITALFARGPLLAVAFTLFFAPFQRASADAPDEIRALWIQAWVTDLHTPEGIDRVIADAKAANINTLVPQVRRRGDTLYFSEIEPRASGVQADFDALAYIIEKAHAQNPPMEVHAWIVVYPIGDSSNPEHTRNKHPEWLMQNADGSFNAPNYQHDPGHPGVHQHLLDVSMELVENYPIDGLHFDYVRYPEYAGDWGYNPVSVARFQQLYDHVDVPSGSDPEWRQFRRDQVTQTVRRIYLHAIEARPEVKISAATITWGHVGVRTIDDWWTSAAYSAVFQDWRGWMEEGILDLNIPMNYYRHHNNTDPNHAQAYYNWSTFAKDHKYNRHLAIGPGIYLNTLSNAIIQMRHTREPTPSGNTADGNCGYVYHVTNNEGLPFSEFRKAVSQPSIYDLNTPPMYIEQAAIPPMPWKETPSIGHLKGYVRNAATLEPLDGAIVHLTGSAERTIQTDPHGFYGFVDLPPGDYFVSATWEGDPSPAAAVSVSVGLVSNLDLNFEVPLPTEGQLEGTVRNAATTQPVEGATVTLSGAANANVQTTAEGFYRFGDLPPGNYTVSASWSESPDDTPATMVSVTAGHTTLQDLNFAVAGSAGPPGEEIILDNLDQGVTFTGPEWVTGSIAGGYATDYRFARNPSHSGYAGLHAATFLPDLPAAGLYRIETWYLQGSNRATNAAYTISDGQNETVVFVNQQENGSQWFALTEEIYLDPTDVPFVRIENNGTHSVTIADAIRWSRLEPIEPEYLITAQIEGQGRIEGLPENGIAGHGAMLQLQAVGENGDIFSHWNGKNAWGTENPLTLQVGSDLEIGAVFVSAWEQWIEENFTESGQADPSFIAPDADPFGQGISNLLNFAFGLDPRQPDRTLLPAVTINATGIVLTFRRLQINPDLDYIIEYSSDLNSWSSDPQLIEEISATPNGDGAETVTVHVSADGNQRLFVRLLVEQMRAP